MRIYLRPLTLDDTKLIIKWRNDSKVLEHCLSKQRITESSHLAFYKEKIETGLYKQFIVELIEDISGVVVYPIATVYLKNIDKANKSCELCIFTSNDSDWTSESQTMAIKMLVDKAFTEYGIHKVYTYVFPDFIDEIELIKNAGFIEEAILKEEAVKSSGDYVDIIRLCMFNKC